MATGESLKRLGGGRWETKDGRFAIEPESGTWVIVDQEQTDEMGLPLVRGPFASLTAAKEAIDTVRTSAPAESPLAERMKQAPKPAKPTKAEAAAAAKPPPPPEPRWLRSLGGTNQKKARALIERLEAAKIADPEEIARAEIADGEPAVARLALERRIERAVAAKTPRRAVRELVDVLVEGRDEALGATWRLVDGEGREIGRLDLPGDD